MMKKKKSKKKLIILLSAAGVILILLIAAVQYTSTSQFCSSCHYMKPYFQSWETSSHKDFECSICHYPPGGGIRSKLKKKIEGLVMVGRYWTKLYVKSKPWAEINDESCLKEGCHDKRLLEGQVAFNNVVFDHKIHFEDLKRGKRLKCTSCHSQIVQGEHITVTESSCFLCHFKESEHYPKIQECSHCHNEKNLISEETSKYNHTLVFENGFACNKCHSNTIIGDGAVPKESCYKCHAERERIEQFENTDLMHTLHIYENKIECNQCHLEIQHKIIKDIEAIADCKSCHLDTHKAQEILYVGEGGSGVSHPMPNIMLEKGMSCKGCHIFHEEAEGRVMTSETYTSRAEACESCHGKGFARIMREWELSTEKKLVEIRAIYTKTSQELKRKECDQEDKCLALLREAAFNIDIVERGKGVHNVEYSQELLAASYTKLLEALKTMGSSYKPKSFIAKASEIPTLCSTCHAGIEEINKEIYGMNFPHKKHLIKQKIKCDTCHSNVRKHGEFIATKKSCAVCHHKEPEKDCTACHQIQTAIYQGGSLIDQEIPQDIMFEAEVQCMDCHLSEQDQIFRSNRAKCLDCHEEDYGDMFDEWQGSVKDLISSTQSSLNTARRRSGLSGEERQMLNKINQLLQKIKQDGSSGIHNYGFIEEILTMHKNYIESIDKVEDEEKKLY